MSYKDMTYCPFYLSCVGGDHCFRALTMEIREAARKFGADICQFADYPECHKATIEKFEPHKMNGQTA